MEAFLFETPIFSKNLNEFLQRKIGTEDEIFGDKLFYEKVPLKVFGSLAMYHIKNLENSQKVQVSDRMFKK